MVPNTAATNVTNPELSGKRMVFHILDGLWQTFLVTIHLLPLHREFVQQIKSLPHQIPEIESNAPTLKNPAPIAPTSV